MAKKLQLRGGTTSQHSTFTGALREVTVDTDLDTLVVHDGTLAGGHVLVKADGSVTIDSFRSTGIDDNSNALAMTIDSSENITCTGSVTATTMHGDGSALTGLFTEFIPTISTNGQTDFVHTYVAGRIQVYLNGIKLVNLSDYETAKAITVMADPGGGITTITSTAHGRTNGDTVNISGTTSYDGYFTISNVATDTFTIPMAFVANDATGTYTVGTPDDYYATDGTNVILTAGVQTTSDLEFVNY